MKVPRRFCCGCSRVDGKPKRFFLVFFKRLPLKPGHAQARNGEVFGIQADERADNVMVGERLRPPHLAQGSKDFIDVAVQVFALPFRQCRENLRDGLVRSESPR